MTEDTITLSKILAAAAWAAMARDDFRALERQLEVADVTPKQAAALYNSIVRNLAENLRKLEP